MLDKILAVLTILLAIFLFIAINMDDDTDEFFMVLMFMTFIACVGLSFAILLSTVRIVFI